MNMKKIALASAASLGLVLAGTAANAEPVRAAAATPGVVSVKKLKVVRTAAPKGRESLAAASTAVVVGGVAGVAGVAGIVAASSSDDSTGG